MDALYVLYGVAGLLMVAMNWLDLLIFLFWIGTVILLGMLEKAIYFREYKSINGVGKLVNGALISAQLMCAPKCILAHVLVIMVSLGSCSQTSSRSRSERSSRC